MDIAKCIVLVMFLMLCDVIAVPSNYSAQRNRLINDEQKMQTGEFYYSNQILMSLKMVRERCGGCCIISDIYFD